MDGRGRLLIKDKIAGGTGNIRAQLRKTAAARAAARGRGT
jgi:hypothetical protein